jgi:hypothetical protein
MRIEANIILSIVTWLRYIWDNRRWNILKTKYNSLQKEHCLTSSHSVPSSHSTSQSVKTDNISFNKHIILHCRIILVEEHWHYGNNYWQFISINCPQANTLNVAGWAPKLVWTLWRKGKLLAHVSFVGHPASYPMGTGRSFTGGKAAILWGLSLTSIQWRGNEWWSYTSTPPYVFIEWCLIN